MPGARQDSRLAFVAAWALSILVHGEQEKDVTASLKTATAGSASCCPCRNAGPAASVGPWWRTYRSAGETWASTWRTLVGSCRKAEDAGAQRPRRGRYELRSQKAFLDGSTRRTARRQGAWHILDLVAVVVVVVVDEEEEDRASLPTRMTGYRVRRAECTE